MIGGDVVRDVVEDQLHAATGQSGPCRRQRLRTPEGCVGDVPPDAVRRPDDVPFRRIGEGVANRFLEGLVRTGYPQSLRTPLPDSHQPDRVDSLRRDCIPIRLFDVAEGDRTARGA